MENVREIVWDEKAFAQLENIFRYIRESSPQNADNLMHALHERIEQILLHPEKHPVDKYRLHNKGDFRAFEIHHIRVAYKITPTYILIIRVRSTHQEPLEY